MSASVAHCRRSKFTTYIGRACAEFPESIFHNPFRIGKDGTRAEVIAKFAAYFYAPEQWDLRLATWHLSEDVILGCWCHPEACHGDIIAGYVNLVTERTTVWGSIQK